MSDDARAIILKRIHAAHQDRVQPSLEHRDAQWKALPRDYDSQQTIDTVQMLNLLEGRLRDYGAAVQRVRVDDVAVAIAGVIADRGCDSMLIPPGFPRQWLPELACFRVDDGLTPQELDRFSGVITGAVLAIAETGTVVLQNVAGQGSRAGTLVPDFHLCVVRAEDVVQKVPEAFARLAATATLPTTFVSGPSATADIEMTRIKGVHGPRFLFVLLVTE